jgi:hypothetical protein
MECSSPPFLYRFQTVLGRLMINLLLPQEHRQDILIDRVIYSSAIWTGSSTRQRTFDNQDIDRRNDGILTSLLCGSTLALGSWYRLGIGDRRHAS